MNDELGIGFKLNEETIKLEYKKILGKFKLKIFEFKIGSDS